MKSEVLSTGRLLSFFSYFTYRNTQMQMQAEIQIIVIVDVAVVVRCSYGRH